MERPQITNNKSKINKSLKKIKTKIGFICYIAFIVLVLVLIFKYIR